MEGRSRMVDNDVYEEAYQTYGLSHKSLLWGREERQYITYRVLTRNVSFRDKSLLDVGCGFGDFLDFLQKTGDCPDFYVGIDQNDKFVGKCVERFGLKPCRTFLTDSIEEFSEEHMTDKFDWVVAIGVAATIPTQDSGPGLDVFRLMSLMWQYAKEGIALTCLSAVDYRGMLHSHEPGTVLRWALLLSPHVSCLHDYGEQEFIVIARKCANGVQR